MKPRSVRYTDEQKRSITEKYIQRRKEIGAEAALKESGVAPSSVRKWIKELYPEADKQIIKKRKPKVITIPLEDKPQQSRLEKILYHMEQSAFHSREAFRLAKE